MHDKSVLGAASSSGRQPVGTRNLDWSKGGKKFLQIRLVAFLASGGAAITIVYRLYGER